MIEHQFILACVIAAAIGCLLSNRSTEAMPSSVFALLNTNGMTRKPPRKPPDKCKAQSFAFRKSIPRMCANDPEHKTLASSSRMSDNDHPDTDTSNGDSALMQLQNSENMPRVRLGCSFQLGLLQNNEKMPRVRLGCSFQLGLLQNNENMHRVRLGSSFRLCLPRNSETMHRVELGDCDGELNFLLAIKDGSVSTNCVPAYEGDNSQQSRCLNKAAARHPTYNK